MAGLFRKGTEPSAVRFGGTGWEAGVEAGGGHPQHDEPAAVKKGQLRTWGNFCRPAGKICPGIRLSPLPWETPKRGGPVL